MKLARIGSTGPTWRPDDLTGAGAAASPGRWNKAGEAVIYVASTLALAVLESAAHIDDNSLPLNKYVIEIDVPDAVWNARKILAANALDVGWDAIPHGVVSVQTGSAWYRGGRSALLQLPSVIVPEENIILINCRHADADGITARATRRYQYNLLFRSGL